MEQTQRSKTHYKIVRGLNFAKTKLSVISSELRSFDLNIETMYSYIKNKFHHATAGKIAGVCTQYGCF